MSRVFLDEQELQHKIDTFLARKNFEIWARVERSK